MRQRKKESYTQVLPQISGDGKEEDWREQLMYVTNRYSSDAFFC